MDGAGRREGNERRRETERGEEGRDASGRAGYGWVVERWRGSGWIGLREMER